MNILSIVIKEFKHNARNWKANSMMVLFPIVLIVILGAAFSNIFTRSIDLEGVKVLYTVQSGDELGNAFESFSDLLSKDMKITFDKTDDTEKGLKSAQDTEYACYIVLKDNPQEIKIYKNERYNTGANMVESMLKVFTQRYGAIAEVVKVNPSLLASVMNEAAADFVSIQSINSKKQPGALDYYAVTMLTLILMYASQTGFWAVKSEKNQGTGNRILCAPVRRYEVLVGKVLGCILITLVQALVVLLFSKLILKADWGSDIFTVLVLVIAESIMTISLGVGCGFLFKNDGAAQGILNTLIPVVAFFGGNYTPMSIMGAGMARLSSLSPLKWVNDALFRVIYDADYSMVLPAIFITLGVSAVFLAVSAYFSSKEAV